MLRPRCSKPSTPGLPGLPITLQSSKKDQAEVTAKARKHPGGELVLVAAGWAGTLPVCPLYDLCLRSEHGQLQVHGRAELAGLQLRDLVEICECEMELKQAIKHTGCRISVQVFRMNPTHQGKQLDASKYGRMLSKVNQRDGLLFEGYSYEGEHGWVWKFALAADYVDKGAGVEEKPPLIVEEVS
eukprot:TRINITY_DN5663_c0_g1_i18.p1 TRINITY_DN5663_c0_g1~~TRINITY_DN5663_c0_g1_i18.p1  ORF type:complete len:185 (+),score=37.68 TRINITY_DN5663_c0_g1_i18:830-1384(+)